MDANDADDYGYDVSDDVADVVLGDYDVNAVDANYDADADDDADDDDDDVDDYDDDDDDDDDDR